MSMKDVTPMTIFGKEYQVYTGSCCSAGSAKRTLYVEVTDMCNAKCGFCSLAKTGGFKKQIEGLRNQLYKQKELVEDAYFKGKENGIIEAFGAAGTRTCAQWSDKADLAHGIIDEYGKLSGLNNKSIQTWVRVEQMCRNYAEGATE